MSDENSKFVMLTSQYIDNILSISELAVTFDPNIESDCVEYEIYNKAGETLINGMVDAYRANLTDSQKRAIEEHKKGNLK